MDPKTLVPVTKTNSDPPVGVQTIHTGLFGKGWTETVRWG